MVEASSGALHEFSRAIGALEASVANLTKIVDREADNASQHREGLREVLAALTESVRVLTDHNDTWRREWADRWEPLLEHYEASKHERAGRAKLTSGVLALWAALGASAMAFANWAMNHWK